MRIVINDTCDYDTCDYTATMTMHQKQYKDTKNDQIDEFINLEMLIYALKHICNCCLTQTHVCDSEAIHRI